MNLDAWLRQDHSLADQLKVIEGLCRALNEAHERGVIHRGLDPSRVEVESDGRCELGGAVSGMAAAAYRAPELSEGGSPSPQSDIYSAGVICYEMLSGRTPQGERPTPLADLRPDVSRDLTDAVMGCLEKGPDWRPKDLSYLLQVVGTLRSAGGKGGGRAAARSAEPVRSAPKSVSASSRRQPARGGSKSNLPLLAVVAVLVVGAGAGYFYFKQAPAPETQVATTTPQPTVAAATPTPIVEATPTPTGPVVATPKVVEPKAAATPTPATATPVPTPTPRAAAVATPVPAGTPVPVVVATPVQVATPPPTPPPATEAAAPALLTAVSPLTVKRGGTTMLDLRGSGLRAEQQARIIKIKDNTDGISIQRQKFMDATLIKVLISLDPNVPPGLYAIALSDSAGGLTNTLSFTVVK